jgi:hypothetical protein
MDSQSAGGLPAAGWYPDPVDRHELRYWDGATWIGNVADLGQASVDPVEVPPAQSTTPAPYAPAGEKPASRGAKKLVILGAVLLLLAAVGAGGWTVLSESLAAKGAAASSIATAREAIAAADPAVEPGSPELAESQTSKSELDEATSLDARGSLVDAGPYRDAKVRADQARAVAQGITDRVSALAAGASAASPEEAIGLYFALEKKYPRTQQGRDAIANAATALLENLRSSDLDDLNAVSGFCSRCPGDVPSSVYDAAATSIKSIADASIDQQASVVSSNRSWVTKIRGKGANFTISSTTAVDTGELTHIIGVLPAVHGVDFRATVTLLRDCSRLGERCGKIARSPVKKSSSVVYFSRSQVNTIATLSSQMDAKLTRARGLLKRL